MQSVSKDIKVWNNVNHAIITLLNRTPGAKNLRLIFGNVNNLLVLLGTATYLLLFATVSSKFRGTFRRLYCGTVATVGLRNQIDSRFSSGDLISDHRRSSQMLDNEQLPSIATETSSNSAHLRQTPAHILSGVTSSGVRRKISAVQRISTGSSGIVSDRRAHFLTTSYHSSLNPYTGLSTTSNRLGVTGFGETTSERRNFLRRGSAQPSLEISQNRDEEINEDRQENGENKMKDKAGVGVGEEIELTTITSVQLNVWFCCASFGIHLVLFAHYELL